MNKSEFKVGDEVICIKDNIGFYNGQKGIFLEDKKNIEYARYLVKFTDGCKIWCYEIRHIESQEENNLQGETMSSYEFKTSSLSAIDILEIAKECTRNNPILLVEVEADINHQQVDLRAKMEELEVKYKSITEDILKVPEGENKQESDDIIEELNTQLETAQKQYNNVKLEYENSIAQNKQVAVVIHSSVLYKSEKCEITCQFLEFDEYQTSAFHVEYSQISEIKKWVINVINAKWPDQAKTIVKVKSLI